MAAERAARAFENDAHMAGARADDLQRAIEDRSRVADDARAQEEQSRQLERTTKLLKDELEAASAKYQQALAREREKGKPADPRMIQLGMTLFATLGAFFLAIGAIIFHELFGGASADDVPVQATLESAATPSTNSADAGAPSDPSPEDAKNAGAHIPFTDVACVRVLVAPCGSNEQAQGAAIALGRNLARRGRALLIAADRGAARIDALASVEGAPKGLADLLRREISYSDSIYRDGGSPLQVIPGGVGADEEAADASEGDEELESAINALAHAYDFLVIAASPKTARRLAPLVDLAFVIGGAEAESLRAELAGAGADAFLLEDGVNADDLVAAE